jgi:glutamine amidotransferase
MCRHLAYLGPPTTLRSLLIDPPHGLYRQAWAPRRQRQAAINADGFGIGWYADGDPVPARYRRGVPIWGDPSLPDVARVTRSAAVLAAVRDASPGTAVGEQAAAPFASGRWLFSHNGALDGWPASAVALAPTAATMLSLEAMVDSAFLWALALGRLRAGAAMDTALAATIAAVEAAGGTGRFNFLLTDGTSIAATACGDTLWYRRSAESVIVASEPGDDQPGWTEVPGRHVLTATPSQVTVRPLAALTPATAGDGARASSVGGKPADSVLATFRSASSSTASTTTSAPKGS